MHLTTETHCNNKHNNKLLQQVQSANNKMSLKKKYQVRNLRQSLEKMLWQTKKTCIFPENYSPQESDLFQRCRKLGIHFQAPPFNETKREHSLRVKRNKNKLQQQKRSFTSQQKNCHHHLLYQKMVTSIRSWTACEHLK